MDNTICDVCQAAEENPCPHLLYFQGIPNKMLKRLDPWKGKCMTSGGKLILSNSCLTSLPMYVMGFYLLPYLLPKGMHKKMDAIRGKFFWQGVGEAFKYE